MYVCGGGAESIKHVCKEFFSEIYKAFKAN